MQRQYEEALELQNDHGLTVIAGQPAEVGNSESGKRPAPEMGLIQPYLTGEKRLSDADLQRLFQKTRNNVLIVCGRIAVLDADSQEGAERVLEVCDPTGWIVESGGGGRHFYYNVPEGMVVGNRQKIDGLDLDRRGQGGLIVGPKSRHHSGREYRFLLKKKMATYDPNWFPKDKYPLPADWKIETSDIEEMKFRARRYISKIKSVAGEGGDKALFRAACVLVQRFDMEPGEALEELKIWNHFCADPPWSEERLRYKVQEAYRLRGQ